MFNDAKQRSHVSGGKLWASVRLQWRESMGHEVRFRRDYDENHHVKRLWHCVDRVTRVARLQLSLCATPIHFLNQVTRQPYWNSSWTGHWGTVTVTKSCQSEFEIIVIFKVWGINIILARYWYLHIVLSLHAFQGLLIKVTTLLYHCVHSKLHPESWSKEDAFSSSSSQKFRLLLRHCSSSCFLVFQAAVTPELSYIPLKSNMPEELLQDHCIKYLSAQSDGRKQRFPPHSSGGLCEQGRVAGELIE